jgi:uncharacterized protein (DUF2132 family)
VLALVRVTWLDVQDPRDPKTPDEGQQAEPMVSSQTVRSHPKDPLHGLTLKDILTQLHARYGWEGLGSVIQIRCFTHDPSMGSSLAFLRRQPWARREVEQLFLRSRADAEAFATGGAEEGEAAPEERR